MLACGLGLAALATTFADEGEESGTRALETDSRAPYVHRLTLYDHDGGAIDPTDDFAGPYSPSHTCGKCHDYGVIRHGWHFNAPVGDTPAGRPGEPWLLVDRATGTVLPISARGWPGTFTPEQLGLSSWEMVKRFGRQMPGGGFGEPSDDEKEASKKADRWRVSGPLEIDCLFCHSVDQQHDPSEASRQIERENFRWSPTATFGVAVVRGEASKAPDDWDPLAPPNPDFPEQSGPRLVWDARRFDPDDRVLFPIVRRPPNERCYFCHSERQVGAEAPEEPYAARDVHMAAGILCADCHGNDLDHMIARGYPDEVLVRADPRLAAYTCEGCHLGVASKGDSGADLGGRYGAPHPLHRGLPPIHFEKLSCTACHSGPWPRMNAQQFQTALAHGLGLATRERTDDDWPQIVAPIFARERGRITPQRMVWPRYWARVEAGDLKPILPDEVRAAARALLPKEGELLPEQIAAIRAALQERTRDDAAVVYVARGEILGDDQAAAGLSGSPVVQPYRWAIGHDVRPAAQSLGVRGCTDCHAEEGPIYFGRVAPADSGAGAPALTMAAFRGDDEALARAWNAGFTARPSFKVYGFVCAALIALLLLRLVAGFSPPAAQRSAPPARLGTLEHLVHALAIAGIGINATTGVLFGVVLENFGGWALLLHMVGAGLFVTGFTGTALLWMRRYRRPTESESPGRLSLGQRALFCVVLLLGLLVMLPMLAAMLPVFGYAGQDWLVEAHEYFALLFLVALLAHTLESLRVRFARGVKS